jgi:hypothetical protein
MGLRAQIRWRHVLYQTALLDLKRSAGSTISLLLLVIAVSFLWSCTPRIRTEVTRFNQMPLPVAGVTLAVLPLGSQEGDLEFSKYAGLVRDQLRARGYGLTENPSRARYWVTLTYVINGRLVQSQVPISGQTGGGTTTINGSLGGQSYSGVAYTQPTYGVVGSETVSGMLYSRSVSVTIIDIQKSSPNRIEQVFKADAISNGPIGSLPRVIPYMIDAISKDFPGVNGETITVVENPS